MNRATYICDECEREFAGPVWHCTTCQRHNQPDHRTCRCGEECPLPKEWFDQARDAQWNAATKGLDSLPRWTRYQLGDAAFEMSRSCGEMPSSCWRK